MHSYQLSLWMHPLHIMNKIKIHMPLLHDKMHPPLQKASGNSKIGGHQQHPLLGCHSPFRHIIGAYNISLWMHPKGAFINKVDRHS